MAPSTFGALRHARVSQDAILPRFGQDMPETPADTGPDMAKIRAALEKAGVRPVDEFRLDALRTVLSTGSPLAPSGFDFVYDAIGSDLQLSLDQRQHFWWLMTGVEPLRNDLAEPRCEVP